MNVQKIINKQRNFFNANQTKALEYRKKLLLKLKSVLKAHEKEMEAAIYADFKKSPFDCFTNELGLLYLDIDEALKKLKKWNKPKRVSTNLINFPSKNYIIREPYGVSLIIGAWNYPFQLSFAPVIPALAAGNTVVLKPSEVPSNTSKLIAKMINENFDASVFTVVEGGVPETTELLAQKFDKIFFTGSVPVGKIVYQAAAKHLTPVTLELGGKSPAIITEKCNLDVALKRLLWAKFLNAGQTCIAPDYIMVHKNIKENFIKKAKEFINEQSYSIERENYVQIINAKNIDRLKKLIDPEKVILGGEVNTEARIINPTLMDNVSFSDPVMQEEIFGPILPIITYENLDDAIQQIKALPKPLACYILTKEKDKKDKILKELSFGGGAVNEAIMHITNSNLPFGGVGESGIGNYHGDAGFNAFTHEKSIMEKQTWFEPNFKFAPYTEKKFKLVKWLIGR